MRKKPVAAAATGTAVAASSSALHWGRPLKQLDAAGARHERLYASRDRAQGDDETEEIEHVEEGAHGGPRPEDLDPAPNGEEDRGGPEPNGAHKAQNDVEEGQEDAQERDDADVDGAVPQPEGEPREDLGEGGGAAAAAELVRESVEIPAWGAVVQLRARLILTLLHPFDRFFVRSMRISINSKCGWLQTWYAGIRCTSTIAFAMSITHTGAWLGGQL